MVVGTAQFDVCDPLRQNRHFPTLLVGQPQDPVGVRERVLDALTDIGTVGVIGQLEFDLTRGVLDANSNVHSAIVLNVPTIV